MSELYSEHMQKPTREEMTEMQLLQANHIRKYDLSEMLSHLYGTNDLFVQLYSLGMPVFTYKIKTAGVGTLKKPDGSSRLIYLFNPVFFDSLNKKERLFIVCHEALHCFFKHEFPKGIKTHEARLMNIAMDMVINEILTQTFRMPAPTSVPVYFLRTLFTQEQLWENGLDRGSSWKEVYECLLKKYSPLPNPSSGQSSGEQGEENEQGKGQSQQQQGQNQQGQGQSQTPASAEDFHDTLDQHLGDMTEEELKGLYEDVKAVLKDRGEWSEDDEAESLSQPDGDEVIHLHHLSEEERREVEESLRKKLMEGSFALGLTDEAFHELNEAMRYTYKKDLNVASSLLQRGWAGSDRALDSLIVYEDPATKIVPEKEWIQLLKWVNKDLLKEETIQRLGYKRRNRLYQPAMDLMAMHGKPIALPAYSPQRTRKKDKPIVMLVLDTSGSMEAFQHDLREISMQIPRDHFEVYVYNFADNINRVETDKNGFFGKVHSGGGTAPFQIIEDEIQDEIKSGYFKSYPDAVVVLTDGATRGFTHIEENNKCKWLFLLASGTSKSPLIEQMNNFVGMFNGVIEDTLPFTDHKFKPTLPKVNPDDKGFRIMPLYRARHSLEEVKRELMKFES